MAERTEESASVAESLVDDIAEKFHSHDSSASESEDEKLDAASSPIKEKVWRFFGREQPVHDVFGGGKPADVFLWRDKKVSSGVLGVATATWILFELFQYHVLTLVCHGLILSMAILFLWSNATIFINKSPPRIPEIHIPEDLAVNIALTLRCEINSIFSMLRDIALGRDLRKFLAVIAGLWILSVIGNCYSLLTLFYLVIVFLHTLPLLYEKYEDKVDAFGEKAMTEIKKQYAVFDAKFLSKIPNGLSKNKKQ
ncbi:unnamed protein product [Spirodela intermedia]|uniref:Reticulon-like protein n=1 Tax=Spirodela intermedia TaxID=51605 RepID=A0A7I8KY00_SPIIN|nr:unnamed protein product [Spirodela intermedia]